MFQLIVFDLDGTLIDSRRDLANATNALLVECGAAPLAEERVGRMVGDGAATLVARAFAASGVAQPPDALDRFLRIYGDHLLDHTQPYPGIAAALDSLGARSRLALLTNKPLASTRRILDGLALAPYFAPDAVIGGDGPFPRKPDPAGLRHLAECAHVPLTDTLLVGDSAIDWRTARAAPSPLCLVRYGFGFDGIAVDQLGVEVRVISNPNELMSL
ncbi:MAG TPA: HAD hydrolase-like protein [Vicinamibacterales bacterium]|nr:HAD hydrolase-like protein [Vicinamibacterales bacterium]